MNSVITQKKLDQPFVTESGFLFENPDVSFKTWGTLNARRDNVILICHALTGNPDADDWFKGLFVKDGLCDAEKYFILCINVPGSCYGSIGPVSINPKTGKPWRSDFPILTIRDMVRFQQLVLNELGIRGIEIVIGGSMGGMQALEFAIMDDKVKSAAVLAAGARHEAWAIAISEAQRQAIYADANWKDGAYSDDAQPVKGISAARMMAMITYRSQPQYNQRFERETRGDGLFQVASYLQYQGEKLAKRFDALSYVRLTQSMDKHDVGRGRGGLKKALVLCRKPVLVVGIDSDLLYPVNEQRELASMLPNGKYAEIRSPYGHDAFLIEFEALNKIIHDFLDKNVYREYSVNSKSKTNTS